MQTCQTRALPNVMRCDMWLGSSAASLSKKAGRQTHRQAGRQANRQTDRQTDTVTNRQADRHTKWDTQSSLNRFEHGIT